jgi:2-methylcitrate dehydratase PrpD
VSGMSKRLSRRIAEFAVSFDASQITPDLFEQTGRALVDTFAVAVAGVHEDASQLALGYVAPFSTQQCVDGIHASLWGQDGMVPVELAALWNGIAGHVLDYDDVTSPMRGHPSVAMLPALVAVAESLDASGSDLVCAYLVGFEVIGHLARRLAISQYERGWHTTATIGILGATAGCARLLKLDVEQTISALGLAVAQAAGTLANFGSHAKSFQAGHANAAAVRSALLARQGFTASEDALDGSIGYASLYAAESRPADDNHTFGTLPLEFERYGLEVKKYPLCYATHRALDGILALRDVNALTLEKVDRVEVKTSRGALRPLVHHSPRTGLQGKFSMEYAMAAALADGHVSLSSFTDSAVHRPSIQDFLPKVTSTEVSTGDVFPRWAEVTVLLRDGERLTTRVEQLRGSAGLPLTIEELGTKVAGCLAWGRSGIDASQLMRNAMMLAGISVRDFLSGSRGRSGLLAPRKTARKQERAAEAGG